MPVFTTLGTALLGTAAATAAAGTALSVGIGATAVAAGVGAAAYGAAGGFDSKPGESPEIDNRVSEATGALTEAEAQTASKKRAYRSGVLFTSPTGLNSDARTSSAKLR